MRSFISTAGKFISSLGKLRGVNTALFGLILLLTGIAIGNTSVPQFVHDVWAAAISGGGTVTKVAAFTASDTIGDSIMTQNTSVNPPNITVGGTLTVTGGLEAASFNTGSGNLITKGISASSITTTGDIITKGITMTSFTSTGASNIVQGDLQVNGSFSAATKNFLIDHPLKSGYQLVHSSLEGPEVPVFYRGTARLSNGTASVPLPDYFDALTRDHTATVLLTAKGYEPFVLSYDGFDEKSFTVHGTKANGEFDWEVKAVRADVPLLEVERMKK